VPAKAPETETSKGSSGGGPASGPPVPVSSGRFSKPIENGSAAIEPSADPSLAWAAVEGAKRFAVSNLLAMRDGESCTRVPDAFSLAEPIMHTYEQKANEREFEESMRASELARSGSSGSGGRSSDRGPMRPKAPPKEYKKPGWAAGVIEGEDAEVMRNARSLLNKLTLEKFDRLSNEFVNLPFTSPAMLEAAVDLVLDKAQMEQHFGAMYADLCLKMAKVPYATLGDDDPNKPKVFKKTLLQKAQVSDEGFILIYTLLAQFFSSLLLFFLFFCGSFTS